MTKRRRGLGWQRDIRHPQDHRFEAPAAQLPHRVELWTPPILDQGPTNSCTGHATASLYRYTLRLLGLPDFALSPAFNYWFGRHVPRLGWENEDEGAMPRDVMQSMISNGVVSEVDWPLLPDTLNARPPQELLAKAKQHKVIEGRYVRMLANDNLHHLKYSLAQRLPFLVGVDVYSSFYDTSDDGMTPMPKTSETYEGGHLIYCNGYDDDLQRFRCPNSWGEGEGAQGVFWLPYAYIANAGLANDFWRVEAVT